MRRFENKVVLITGAASGIGRASAERIAGEGGALFLLDVEPTGLEETAKGCAELGADAATRICDVSDPAAARTSVEAAVQRFGRLDSLCNIAGILHFDHTHELALETWRRILSVNLDGTFFVCQAALPHLLAARGNIVNMSSTAALAGHPWTAAYSASKGGILALTYTLAIEYCSQGLRANAVCPGSITTCRPTASCAAPRPPPPPSRSSPPTTPRTSTANRFASTAGRSPDLSVLGSRWDGKRAPGWRGQLLVPLHRDEGLGEEHPRDGGLRQRSHIHHVDPGALETWATAGCVPRSPLRCRRRSIRRTRTRFTSAENVA